MTKWKTILALIPLMTAIVMEWWWFFTILFVLQIVFSLQAGAVYYVEEIKQKEHPVLFWIIMIIWMFLGIMSSINYF